MISIGAGEELISEYRSVIFYHCGKPEWVETIKVMFSYYSSLLILLTSIYRGRQWETASLILCLRWAACANVAEQIEFGGHFVSLSRKFTSF